MTIQQSALSLIGELAAAAVLAYAALRCLTLARRRRAPALLPKAHLPSISVLKPLCGAEPRQYEQLRSYFDQDYADYQLVFGARSADDAALETVARLCAEFPHREVEIVVDARLHGANPKVSNLINLLPAARHSLLVLADADIRAPRDCLSRLAAEMAEPGTGLVTCLYRSEPQPNLCSQLGALFIDDWFAPSVHVGRVLGLRGLGFGATIALRRETLDAIGGFGVVANQLADDWWLGEHVRRLGLQTRLSSSVVGTLVNEPSLSAMLEHERRWMRVIRSVRPMSYAGMAPTFTMPLALLAAVLGGTPAQWALPCCAALRVLAFMQTQRGAGPGLLRRLALLPLRDVLMVWVWLRGFGAEPVRWRDRELDVDARGLLQTATEEAAT